MNPQILEAFRTAIAAAASADELDAIAAGFTGEYADALADDVAAAREAFVAEDAVVPSQLTDAEILELVKNRPALAELLAADTDETKADDEAKADDVEARDAASDEAEEPVAAQDDADAESEGELPSGELHGKDADEAKAADDLVFSFDGQNLTITGEAITVSGDLNVSDCLETLSGRVSELEAALEAADAARLTDLQSAAAALGLAADGLDTQQLSALIAENPGASDGATASDSASGVPREISPQGVLAAIYGTPLEIHNPHGQA